MKVKVFDQLTAWVEFTVVAVGFGYLAGVALYHLITCAVEVLR